MNTLIKYFRLYGAFLALGAFAIFFIPGEYEEFGELGWKLLLIIMFSKPIYDIFPRITLLWKLLPLRRQLWIICASCIIAHGVGAYLVGWRVTGATLSNPQDFLLWGILGWAVAVPLLLTSNNFAVKLLKKRWKLVQKLAYFFFVFGALHLYFIDPKEYFGVLILLIFWIVLKIMAAKKIVIWKRS